MIKFFRKIRQKLLVENRFNKYLLYAIGEIVLVVIGILIALQINNWNQANKDKAFELKMLNEISKALQSDVSYLREHLIGYRTKESEKSIHYFEKALKKEKVYKDSLEYYFGWVNLGIVLKINEGPYQGLKSIGLDKVSNDSVRNKIQYLYDFLIPRNIDLIDLVEIKYTKKQNPLQESLLGETYYIIKNDSVKYKTKFHKDKFWETSKFIEFLYLGKNRYSYRRNALLNFANDLEGYKIIIDKEIKRLKYD
jgi:hypothetical protein